MHSRIFILGTVVLVVSIFQRPNYSLGYEVEVNLKVEIGASNGNLDRAVLEHKTSNASDGIELSVTDFPSTNRRDAAQAVASPYSLTTSSVTAFHGPRASGPRAWASMNGPRIQIFKDGEGGHDSFPPPLTLPDGTEIELQRVGATFPILIETKSERGVGAPGEPYVDASIGSLSLGADTYSDIFGRGINTARSSIAGDVQFVSKTTHGDAVVRGAFEKLASDINIHGGKGYIFLPFELYSVGTGNDLVHPPQEVELSAVMTTYADSLMLAADIWLRASFVNEPYFQFKKPAVTSTTVAAFENQMSRIEDDAFVYIPFSEFGITAEWYPDNPRIGVPEPSTCFLICVMAFMYLRHIPHSSLAGSTGWR